MPASCNSDSSLLRTHVFQSKVYGKCGYGTRQRRLACHCPLVLNSGRSKLGVSGLRIPEYRFGSWPNFVALILMRDLIFHSEKFQQELVNHSEWPKIALAVFQPKFVCKNSQFLARSWTSHNRRRHSCIEWTVYASQNLWVRFYFRTAYSEPWKVLHDESCIWHLRIEWMIAWFIRAEGSGIGFQGGGKSCYSEMNSTYMAGPIRLKFSEQVVGGRENVWLKFQPILLTYKKTVIRASSIVWLNLYSDIHGTSWGPLGDPQGIQR